MHKKITFILCVRIKIRNPWKIYPLFGRIKCPKIELYTDLYTLSTKTHNKTRTNVL